MDLIKIPVKIKNYCLKHTRKGKVDRLEQLTRALTSNTKLVEKKYGELRVVEVEVGKTLEKLRTETFEVENNEIMNLNLLEENEKKKFIGALVKIKETGIAELEPISETAQRIKAHMLITLNKALIQKAVLISKTRLAGNANLQLETLKLMEGQAENLNIELKGLLEELDKLNEGAIEKFSEFKKDVKSTIGEDGNIISHIFNKLSNMEETTKVKKVD